MTIKTKCGSCHGTGQGYDPTNADKVCSGGTGVVVCRMCRGTGDYVPPVVRERSAEGIAAGSPDWELPTDPNFYDTWGA